MKQMGKHSRYQWYYFRSCSIQSQGAASEHVGSLESLRNTKQNGNLCLSSIPCQRGCRDKDLFSVSQGTNLWLHVSIRDSMDE